MEPRNTEKRPRFVTFFLSPSRLLAEEISLGFRRQFFYDTLSRHFEIPLLSRFWSISKPLVSRWSRSRVCTQWRWRVEHSWSDSRGRESKRGSRFWRRQIPFFFFIISWWGYIEKYIPRERGYTSFRERMLPNTRTNTDRSNLVHLRSGFPIFEEFKSLILIFGIRLVYFDWILSRNI